MVIFCALHLTPLPDLGTEKLSVLVIATCYLKVQNVRLCYNRILQNNKVVVKHFFLNSKRVPTCPDSIHSTFIYFFNKFVLDAHDVIGLGLRTQCRNVHKIHSLYACLFNPTMNSDFNNSIVPWLA